METFPLISGYASVSRLVKNRREDGSKERKEEIEKKTNPRNINSVLFKKSYSNLNLNANKPDTIYAKNCALPDSQCKDISEDNVQKQCDK